MSLLLDYTKIKSVNKKISISGSKSETNRLLILKQFYPNICLSNESDSNDSNSIKNALTSDKNIIDIHHAGTAMRFLTAYYAINSNRNVILTGSNRMKQRPIKDLVFALTSLGAVISYVDKIGFPPLRINGKFLTKDVVAINGNISSQFITALILIAPILNNGLTININNKLVSTPYVLMTLSLLNELGISTGFNDYTIKIKPKKEIYPIKYLIESDWSSASYYYSVMSIISSGTLKLNFFKEKSMQGDSQVSKIYKKLGVNTLFNDNGIVLSKIDHFKKPKFLAFDCANFPDLAQTIIVSCFAKGIPCKLTGLKTLKIKETDRIIALKTELEKFNAIVNVTNESIEILNHNPLTKKNSPIQINTYQDHRMAMAFAPLSFITPLKINNSEVVAKSYLNFWKDFDFNNR